MSKVNSPFLYSGDNKRYHTYHYYLSRRFGGKVSRIGLNAGFTCPNLDGTKGTGGCTFCSNDGGGTFAGNPAQEIAAQFETVAARMAKKWETQRHIAYLQVHSNTYAPVQRLREIYDQALLCPGVVGLSIATRPDCVDEEIAALLGEYAQKTYLTVELGLQTIHDETAKTLNRCHTYDDFMQAYERLRRNEVPVGVHIINGLPGETHEMMLETAKNLAKLELHLVKIHLLHLLKGTKMAQEWEDGKVTLLSMDEYVRIVCDQLEVLPPEFVIGRLTGDGAPDELLGPMWSLKKFCVMNEIDKELVRRNSWQGIRC